MLLGIAGKTGSGKNHVAELLEDRGWSTLDLDLVAHRSLDILAESIENRLGPGLLVNGSINRKELGRKVFTDPESLARLEQITYPWIEKETRRWIEENHGTPKAIHAINLHKTSLPEDCDAVIWVQAPLRKRKKRVMKRDNRPWSELKGRFRSQNGLNSKLFSKRADIYSVRNSGNDASLIASLETILRRL